MPLLAGSPALNAGDPALAGTPDQRGVARTDGVNIGAFQASATSLVVTAAGSVTAGTPFDFAVTAVDPYGNTDFNYQGTVAFSTQDPAGSFNPTGYSFQPGDHGTAFFPQGATLNTPDNTWDVTATDINSGITGLAYVAVTEGPAPHSGHGRPVHRATPDAAALTQVFTQNALTAPTAGRPPALPA
jgi:hypothetical protein